MKSRLGGVGTKSSSSLSVSEPDVLPIVGCRTAFSTKKLISFVKPVMSSVLSSCLGNRDSLSPLVLSVSHSKTLDFSAFDSKENDPAFFLPKDKRRFIFSLLFSLFLYPRLQTLARGLVTTQVSNYVSPPQCY